MFKFLKEKLKSWISKNKEEKEDAKPVKAKTKKEKSTKKTKPPVKTKISSKQNKKSKEVTPAHSPVEETPIVQELEETKNETLQEEIPPTTQEPLSEEEPVQEKKSFFSFMTRTLSEEKFLEMFEELELILLQNNVAYAPIQTIKDHLKTTLVGKPLKKIDLAEELKNAIRKLLFDPPEFIPLVKQKLKTKSPFVILFAGINGSGKTTTIAKVTRYLQKQKLSVCLAASDTFRAASIEQLQEHATRLNVPLIKKDYGSDPASVGFDAIAYAKKHHIDVVLIDTAGRMQNKDSLMKEIEKIARVTNPDLKIFLGESITGNDATEQAKTFNESLNLDGIILSKADVDEKGGTAISVSEVTGKPIFFLGTGQTYDDLEPFSKEKLIEKLGL